MIKVSDKIVIQENKIINQKKQKVLILAGVVASVIAIVSLLLLVTKLVPENIIKHIFYPSLALNILLNGFAMHGFGRKKIAIIDFVFVGLIFVYYILSLIF